MSFPFLFLADSSTSTKEYIDKALSKMVASQKNKVVVDVASIRDHRRMRALETAVERKKKVEAALS